MLGKFRSSCCCRDSHVSCKRRLDVGCRVSLARILATGDSFATAIGIIFIDLLMEVVDAKLNQPIKGRQSGILFSDGGSFKVSDFLVWIKMGWEPLGNNLIADIWDLARMKPQTNSKFWLVLGNVLLPWGAVLGTAWTLLLLGLGAGLRRWSESRRKSKRKSTRILERNPVVQRKSKRKQSVSASGFTSGFTSNLRLSILTRVTTNVFTLYLRRT